jgi:peroxiredoxin
MALTYSQGLPIGTHAPAFELPGTDGNTYHLKSFRDANILVMVFTCNHCPYAQASEQRLIDIQNDFAGKGVQLVLINPNDDTAYPDDSFEHMVQRAKERNYPFPYLRDETQKVAREYNAACTPDIYVFDKERALRYNGRIDDNWKEPDKVTRHELREVLDSIIEGREIPFEQKPSMGCSIKWKQ